MMSKEKDISNCVSGTHKREGAQSKIMFPRDLVKVPKEADLSGSSGCSAMSDPKEDSDVNQAKPAVGVVEMLYKMK